MGQYSFQEVMKQYNRMLEAHKKGVLIPIEASYETAVKQPDFFEKCVMEWAAENPEPVYPTWGEWFTEQGYAMRKMINTVEYGPGEIIHSSKPADVLTDKAYKPIDAETAQKLGIEPKEG